MGADLFGGDFVRVQEMNRAATPRRQENSGASRRLECTGLPRRCAPRNDEGKAFADEGKAFADEGAAFAFDAFSQCFDAFSQWIPLAPAGEKGPGRGGRPNGARRRCFEGSLGGLCIRVYVDDDIIRKTQQWRCMERGWIKTDMDETRPDRQSASWIGIVKRRADDGGRSHAPAH
jgi:hypothetical protein